MIKKMFLLTVFVLMGALTANAQSVFGQWKTIDDETGIEKSIVEIFNKDGKVFAKIVKLLEEGRENDVCEECKGDKKNKPMKGLMIIDGLTKDDGEWSGGKILDPKTGKEYKCYITLEEANKLKVRGYIGFALLGRTQYWYRVTE